MSGSTISLRRKMDTASDLQSVVRTMKAVAASSITQYERAVAALDDYYRTVQLGLAACLRSAEVSSAPPPALQRKNGAMAVLVFGSDQGLVGQFNDVMVDFVLANLADLAGQKTAFPVGERMQARLADTALLVGRSFALPSSIHAITLLVGQVLIELENRLETGEIEQVYVFHNSPHAGAIYTPTYQRLLPLDATWRQQQTMTRWPTKNLPQVVGGTPLTLRAFVREYLFVSLFRACAQSLASENASRLAAMQRAEQNIDELTENLHRSFHRLRQSDIDEELSDVISGFEALTGV